MVAEKVVLVVVAGGDLLDTAARTQRGASFGDASRFSGL